MRNKNNRKSILLATAIMAVSAVIVAVTPGCTTHRQGTGTADAGEGYQDPFFPVEYSRLYDLASYPQAASAARADATLYDIHFHGGKLNSLGEDKVALMLDDDDDARPTLVYIAAAGSDEDYAARQESIRAFVSGHGGTAGADAVRFARGPNPHSRTASAPLLANFNRTDSAPGSGEAAGGDMGSTGGTTGN